MNSQVLHHMPWSSLPERDPEMLLVREWLVANGLGGYASGTISGACTRRFHGLLIAALPAPLGRYLMFNHLAEELKLEDRKVLRLDTEESQNGPGNSGPAPGYLGEFRLETGLPVWQYDIGRFHVEKRILLPHRQNTVYINYRIVAADGNVRIRLRPAFHFRPHNGPVDTAFTQPYQVASEHGRVEIRSEVAPPLRMRMVAPQSSLVLDGGTYRDVHYRLEKSRGYEYEGQVWSPGYFRVDLHEGQQATLVASTEAWDTIEAVDPQTAWDGEVHRRERLIAQANPAARQGSAAQLVLAADQFIVLPTTRIGDIAVAQASGDDVRSVIAGYHWFTDWGRDTMISLEGLTLCTGRHAEAGYMLRSFGRYVRDGLIPNLFPEGEREGLYHTADATLWYFHALHRYLEITHDRDTLLQLLPTLNQIIEHHLRGTHFGIHVDLQDGLLSQGAEGYQLTWMDAKVGDWVVTPRRGKAVEINALWYNALRLAERWNRETENHEAAAWHAASAEKARAAFNARFWYRDGGYLYDIVDGENGFDDPALRPNQLLSFSLEYPVLDRERWKPVLDVVTERLMTPVGLRTLAPGHPDYKPTYDGDLRARDAAYHQGTAWAWLIGPFIDAWLKVHPHDHETALQFLEGFDSHLGEACLGSISEIFDAEAPYYPRGCIAQAWSVAEVLRCRVKAGRPPTD